jgi:hypothetical protein
MPFDTNFLYLHKKQGNAYEKDCCFDWCRHVCGKWLEDIP